MGHDSRGGEGAKEEEKEGYKVDIVGRGGVRLRGRIEEGEVSAAVSAIEGNGSGRDDDVSITSSFFLIYCFSEIANNF